MKAYGSSKENTTGIKLVIHWQGLCWEPENLIPEAEYDTAKCFFGFLQFFGSGLVTFCQKSSADADPEVSHDSQGRLRVMFWLLLYLTNKWTLLYYLMKRLLLFSVNKLQATRSQHIRNQEKIKLDQTVRRILCAYFEQKPELQKST